MKEVIKWDNSGIEIKKAVVSLCGWATQKGTITKTGVRISRTSWNDLTPAARNVLVRHGIEK